MSAVLPLAHTAPLGPEEARRLSVDGHAPSWLATPRTPEEVAEVLRQATAAGLAVSPRGAGTSLGLGAPPARLDVALDLTGLSGLVAYHPEDLTAVALAGTPLSILQETFAREGQWLALDPPYAAQATLGGILAVNDAGPHRLRYGTARNLVLGMQTAQSDGRLVRSGARVVKSVAGYNLHKLHIGALGTLGVIAEVALRLHPLPRARAVVACGIPRPHLAGAIVARLARLPLRLGALDLLNAAAMAGVAGRAGEQITARHPYTLLALCEGHAEVVQRQIDEVTAATVAEGGTIDAVIDGAAAAGRLAEALAAAPESAAGDLVLALGVPPAHTSDLVGALAALDDAAAPGARIIAHAGSGVVYVALTPHPPLPDAGEGEHRVSAVGEGERRVLDAGERGRGAAVPGSPSPPRWRGGGGVRAARALAQERGGHLVVRSCPPEAKAGLDVWGPVAAPALMRRLKETLDPAGTLNPGRFVEGL